MEKFFVILICMSVEYTPGPEKMTDALSIRAQELIPTDDDDFDRYYESFSDFHKSLSDELLEMYPELTAAWESVPAWHALAKSGVRTDLMAEIPETAYGYIEKRISEFLDSLETSNGS